MMVWRDKATGRFKKLRPCRCGSTEIVFGHTGYEGDVRSTWAECPGCAKTAPSVRGHDEVGALEHWNRDEVVDERR